MRFNPCGIFISLWRRRGCGGSPYIEVKLLISMHKLSIDVVVVWCRWYVCAWTLLGCLMLTCTFNTGIETIIYVPCFKIEKHSLPFLSFLRIFIAKTFLGLHMIIGCVDSHGVNTVAAILARQGTTPSLNCLDFLEPLP